MGLLEELRAAEIATLRPWFPAGARVLDVGGGSGWQASILASWGCDVLSIDLVGNREAWRAQYHEVVEYDGARFPAEDAAFDRVFSSCVLQDVPVERRGALLAEMHRVLKPGGLAIHVLPTPSWRVWTTATYNVYLAKRVLGLQHDMGGPAKAHREGGVGPAPRPTTPGQILRRLLVPRATGAYPNAYAELSDYRRSRWTRLFRANGFEPVDAPGTGLFYTGTLIAPSMRVPARRRLARVLGSSCRAFVLRRV